MQNFVELGEVAEITQPPAMSEHSCHRQPTLMPPQLSQHPNTFPEAEGNKQARAQHIDKQERGQDEKPHQEYEKLRQAFFYQNELARVTLDSIGDGVITAGIDGRIRSLNVAAEVLLGWDTSEVVEQKLHDIFFIRHELTGESLPDLVDATLREGETLFFDEHCVLVSRYGYEYSVRISSAPIRDRYARIVGVVLVFRDDSESRRLTRCLSWQATHDSLTQLWNRFEFERRVAHSLAEAKNHHIPSAICYLDLDQFKVVNDTCGHAAGDELLRQLSLLLQQKVGQEGNIIARLGGDEFGLLLTHHSLKSASRVAESILEMIQGFRFIWKNKIFKVGCSIGLIAIDDNSIDLSNLLGAADAACYAAKEGGRNRIHIYKHNDRALVQQRNERQWISRLNQALEENRFCLYTHKTQSLDRNLQGQPPQYLEVLLRLIDEEGKVVLPMAFIPAAERYNLMPILDRWVITTFFTQIASRPFLSAPLTRYGINLSGLSINDPSFLNFLEKSILASSIPAHLLCFEITETAAISNLRSAAQSIQRLKKLGCQFALDDFGSGMSSLAYLKTLPVDYLKIDGSFIRALPEDQVAVAMVEGMHRIAHVMGLKTIAEFVETEQVYQAVQNIGIDYAQGHLVDQPQPFC